MKAILFAVLLFPFLRFAEERPAGQTLEGAMRQAAEEFPALRESGSDFNRLFVAAYGSTSPE